MHTAKVLLLPHQRMFLPCTVSDDFLNTLSMCTQAPEHADPEAFVNKYLADPVYMLKVTFCSFVLLHGIAAAAACTQVYLA